MIEAVSVQFDKQCNRAFARSESATEEFEGDETEIIPVCYPIEAVTRFDLKTNKSDGWVEQTNAEFVVRRECLVSLARPLGTFRQQGRMTYTGGYVLPGGAGQTALPADLEQAAVEQVAAWFQNRDKLGLVRHWPKGVIYEEFAQTDMLVSVTSVLEKYRRVGI